MPLIALIDDRQTNRNIFSHLAATFVEACDIITFADGMSALEAFADRVPDLVISDYNMPGLNGAEFTRAFRALPNCADVPVIVITVHGERARKLTALEAGATDFLSSPVDPVEFVTRGRNLLKLRLNQLQLEKRAQRLKGNLAYSKVLHSSAERELDARLLQVIDSLPIMISAVDKTGARLFANRLKQQFDPPASGARCTLSRDDRALLNATKPVAPFEETLRSHSGIQHEFMMQKSLLRDSGGHVSGILTVGLDVSVRRVGGTGDTSTRDQTAPADRQTLARHMHRIVRRGRRHDRSFALHLVRLHGLSGPQTTTNSALKHHFLQVMMERLGTILRESDMIAQIDGETLAIVQSQIANTGDALRLAKRVQAIVQEGGGLTDQKSTTAASIGVALFPNHAEMPDALLELAQAALNLALPDGAICFAQGDFSTREDVFSQSDVA